MEYKFYKLNLNIHEAFHIVGGETLKYEKFIFPGGEPHIKIDFPEEFFTGPSPAVNILCNIWSMEDLGYLLVATNVLKRHIPSGSIRAVLPYFPGARQDRVTSDGEPFTLKVFADIINAQEYGAVIVLDPHSDVTPALINRIAVSDTVPATKATIESINDPNLILVSPDAGMNKKIYDLAKGVGISNIVKADKIRDVSTGKLSGFEVHSGNLNGAPCLVVDDICDGGGTFIGLGEKLKEKGAGDLYLQVSHGIFSKGQEELLKIYKQVFTLNPGPNVTGILHPPYSPTKEGISNNDISTIDETIDLIKTFGTKPFKNDIGSLFPGIEKAHKATIIRMLKELKKGNQ